MIQFAGLLKQFIDSMPDQVVVIDQAGTIRFANAAWVAFARANGWLADDGWAGGNYLAFCESATTLGEDFCRNAAEGIRTVIGGAGSFRLEYSCHDDNDKRWFIMTAAPLEHENARYTIVTHRNITERKLAEEQVSNLTRIDGLTNLFNRRYFDEFLEQEWKRCCRLHLPLTLAMIDIDHFRTLNEAYGHRYGDVCLIEIGGVLKRHAKRAGDICARHGEDEFAIIFGNSSVQQLLSVFGRIVEEIDALKLPHKSSPTAGIVTVSAGITTMYPSRQLGPETLVHKADELLYLAKEKGRNRIEYL